MRVIIEEDELKMAVVEWLARKGIVADEDSVYLAARDDEGKVHADENEWYFDAEISSVRIEHHDETCPRR